MSSMAMRMAPFRAAAFRQPLLRAPIVQTTLRQQVQALRATRTFTTTQFRPREKNDAHSAHTITQRIRQLKQTPPELIPLFVVILFAVGAAGFALIRKLFTDKTLRLTKSRKPATAESH